MGVRFTSPRKAGCIIGLTEPVNTYHPFRLMIVEFAHMGRSMKQMPSAGDSAQVPFRPPHWKPSGD